MPEADPERDCFSAIYRNEILIKNVITIKKFA
jgi:hypothetical protein